MGDTVLDRKYHGGRDQALYAYAAEDLAAWARELGRELHPGQFGFTVRFDYGSVVPWVRNIDGHVHMVAGPNALRLTSTIPLEGAEMRHQATFTVRAGDKVPFTLDSRVTNTTRHYDHLEDIVDEPAHVRHRGVVLHLQRPGRTDGQVPPILSMVGVGPLHGAPTLVLEQVGHPTALALHAFFRVLSADPSR
jgi:hypothetical protein